MRARVFLSFMAVLLACSSRAQLSPKNNVISIDITQPENAAYTYDSCFKQCYALGMREIGLHFPWTNVETAPGVFNMAAFDIANLYYPAYQVPVDLNVDPIETNQLTMPADIAKLALDDPKVIKRFETLLDSIFKHIPALQLSSLVIGSEVNGYLSGDTAKWGQYTRFFNAVSSYARAQRSGLMIATEAMLPGLTGIDSSYMKLLNAKADYIGVSYFPLNGDFTAEPVGVVATDFKKVVALYHAKPIYFYQCGYPSAAICKSSEAQQATFIEEVFNAWNKQAAHIKMVDFTWLHDYSPASVKYWSSFYGITDSVFLGYLGSIGLRNYAANGSEKIAFHALQCLSYRYRFNDLVCYVDIAAISRPDHQFKIYPNPFSAYLTLDASELGVGLHLDIVNEMGVSVASMPLKPAMRIETEALPRGMYLWGIRDKSGRVLESGKVVK